MTRAPTLHMNTTSNTFTPRPRVCIASTSSGVTNTQFARYISKKYPRAASTHIAARVPRFLFYYIRYTHVRSHLSLHTPSRFSCTYIHFLSLSFLAIPPSFYTPRSLNSSVPLNLHSPLYAIKTYDKYRIHYIRSGT
jgi:hypothetical protein